jgi:ankyrin repeat protein
MMAAWNEHSTIIEILLQCNADTATTTNYGKIALHYAAGNNKTTTTIVQLLLNNMKLEDINHKG